MGTKMRVSAAVLVAAVIVYFVARTPQAESPPVAAVEPPAADVELVGAAAVDPAAEAVRRILVAEEPSGGVSVAGTNVLRVILEGITEENARMTTVTLTGVDKRTFDRRLATPDQWRAYVQWIQRSLNRVLGTGSAVDGQLGPRTREAIITFQRREGLPTSGRVDPKTEGALIRYDGTHSYAPKWPAEIRGSWPCQGLTSEFDLDPFFASVAERHENLRVDELEVNVDHPLHLLERIRVPLSRGVELKSGRTVYEVRVRLVPAGVIHGRLARAGGAPAAEGLVGALLLEETTWERPTTNGSTLTDVPIEDEGRAVECAADGAFELRVPASGRYALASYEEGRRPTTTRVEALVGTRVDVGTIVLEPGHAITGHALRHGNPMAGASVSLTPPRVFWAADPADVEKGMNAWIRNWRTFTTRARSVTLAWLESRFELVGQSGRGRERGLCLRRTGSSRVPATCGGAGRVALPAQWWDNTVWRGRAGRDGRACPRARSRAGVQLDVDPLRARGRPRERGRGPPGPEVQIPLSPETSGTFIPEYWSTQFPLSGDEPICGKVLEQGVE